MRLSRADEAFIEKRARRARYWPFAGVGLLAMVVTYAAWLWLTMPHLINPLYLIERLEAGTLAESTMGVMAVMLPIVVVALLAFAVAVVLLWFIPFRNERRLIRLIQLLQADSADNEGKN